MSSPFVRTTCLVILSCFLVAGSLSAQRWQSVGGNLYGVHVSGDDIVAVGHRGQVLRSTDAGAHWHLPVVPTHDDLFDVDFFDAANGLVVATGGVLYRTTDGGASWSLDPYVVGSDRVHIDLVDAMHGVLVTSEGAVHRTTDAGTSWRVGDERIDGSVMSIDFGTPALGIAIADSGRMWRTVDSGATWSRVFDDPTIELWDVDLRSDGVGYAVPPYGAIQKTIDSGATWSAGGSVPTTIFPTSVMVDAEGRIVIAGAYGVGQDIALAATSTDGGASWETAAITAVTAQTSALGDVALLGDGRLVGVGSPGLLVIQNEAGRLDAPSNGMLGDVVLGVAPLQAVGFASADTAVTANHVLADGGWNRTTDGGVTWVHHYRSRSDALLEAHFTSPTDGIFIGSAFDLYSTTDAGLTWRPMTHTTEVVASTVWDVRYRTRELGFIGADDAVLRTTDGGLSWTGTELPGITTINRVHFLDDRIGLAIGLKMPDNPDSLIVSRLYRTDDGGATWRPLIERRGNPLYFSDAHLIDAQRAFLLVGGPTSPTTRQGFIFSTADGGLTWDSLSTDGHVATDIEFFNDRDGYVVGGAFMVMRTSDAGRTWSRDSLWPVRADDRNATISSIALSKDRRTLIAVGNGFIARTELADTLLSGLGAPSAPAAAIGAAVRALPTPAHAGLVRIELANVHVTAAEARVSIAGLDGRTIQTSVSPVDPVEGGVAVDVGIRSLANGTYLATVSIGELRAVCRIVVAR